MLNPIVQSQFNGQLIYPAYSMNSKIPTQNQSQATMMQSTFTTAKPLISKQSASTQNQMINQFFNQNLKLQDDALNSSLA